MIRPIPDRMAKRKGIFFGKNKDFSFNHIVGGYDCFLFLRSRLRPTRD